MNARITQNGAVLLGENFSCDAFAPVPIRVVTHAHSDHLLGLKASIARCESIFATPLTRDLIGVLKGESAAQSIRPLNYGTPFAYKDERITLHPAGHIIGSAQVLWEDRKRLRAVYTGDFKPPGAAVIPCDLLIIEATYGNPQNVRRFRDRVEVEFVSLIKQCLKRGPVYIFGYHGKLQEVMRILTEYRLDLPIVVPEPVYKLVEVCRRYGMEFKRCYYSRSDAGREARKGLHIGIYHVATSRWVGAQATRITLSGWQFDAPYKKTGDQEYIVALSDHADFEELLNYVGQCKPKQVITDNYRVGDAPALARSIRERLGIEAIPLPT
jgi:putative mRNA 3-end processing factor